MSEQENAEKVVGALAAHWASLPLAQRTPERYQLLVAAIHTSLEWLAPPAAPTRAGA